MEQLGNYITIKTGRMDANAADPNGIYPFFTCAKELSRIDNWAFDCECVLVAGNCNPHVSYYKGKFNAYQRVYVIQSRDKGSLNIKYLYYFLKKYMTLVLDRQRGAIEKFFCLDDFTGIKIALPDLPTQLRIAGVLGSIDEKIELNRKKIAELEALAKTIYDYWFVQFDFPDKNGKPYKSSGGKMVWNEQLKREVPEGWEVVPLSDIATITMGQSPHGDSLNESGEGTLFFQGSSDFGDVSPSNRVYTTAPTRMAKSGDILLSVRAPVGTSNIALHSCCIGRGLASLRGKECTNSFVHNALALIKSRFESKNVDGTTFGSLSKDELYNMPILKPTACMVQKFDSLAKPIETNIIDLVHQIRESTILRDTLLPLLMNGQVEVG